MGSLVRRFALIAAIVAALGCLGLLPPLHTRAASPYLVNLPGDAGLGIGLSGDIRYVVTQADANPGSTITFDRAATGPTILLTQGTLTLSANMTITGPGANLLAVDGGCTTCDAPVSGIPSTGATVFAVGLGATVTLSGLTVQHGLGGPFVSQSAGGIVNHGTLALTGDTLVGNVAAADFRERRRALQRRRADGRGEHDQRQ